jgi:Putative Flp pilus-assembly TadE/G-like
MKKSIRPIQHKRERGQAIILIAFGIIGLVAMVGLVIDTGIVFIEYGKLKRSVDAASIAAAQQYRSVTGGTALDEVGMANAAREFIDLNQSDIVNVEVHSCEDADVPSRPDLCNPDPDGNPIANRKLVKVIASKNVTFGFLRVIGINGTTITAESVGEAAALDLVLVVDTSSSMSYATSGGSSTSDAGDDPSVCNLDNSCQPMREVKATAQNFIDTMYFPYDRVAVVPMTSQSNGGTRYVSDSEITPLNSDKATVTDAINALKVYSPRTCTGDGTTPGSCRQYSAGVFQRTICEIYEMHSNEPDADPSSCPSSNVGGVLKKAASLLSNPATQRSEAFWVVVALMGGPANATDPTLLYPNGFCPKNTYFPLPDPGAGKSRPQCRDMFPSVRHAETDTATYVNPNDPLAVPETISVYDADDYARYWADQLATLTSETGVTIYTIGLGAQIESRTTVDDGPPAENAAAEDLLRYIAETAGGPDVNHGQYFFAPTSTALADIFELIANNIATRISQ